MTNKEAIEFANCLKNNWTINFDNLEPFCDMVIGILKSINEMPSAKPEISYTDCANAMVKMWMDKVITDAEYNHIMDKLNAWCGGAFSLKSVSKRRKK